MAIEELQSIAGQSWQANSVVEKPTPFLDFDGSYLLSAKLESRCSAFLPACTHIRNILSELTGVERLLAGLVDRGGELTLRLAVLSEPADDQVHLEHDLIQALARLNTRLQLQCMGTAAFFERISFE